MQTNSTHEDRKFGLSADELSFWDENGYLIRLGVFTAEDNDALRQVAEDVVDGKRPFPSAHIVDILPELKQRGFLALILEKVRVVSKRLFLLPSLVPPNEVLFGLHKRFFVSRHVLPRHFSSLLQR